MKKFGRKNFLVRYDCPDELYSQPLFEELKAGNVRVVELKGEDVIGASVRHMFEGDETGENIWWNAERVDPDLDSDPENPEVFVMYDENGEAEEGQQEKQEYYLEPLLGDYLHHCVQIVSLDLHGETSEWICHKATNKRKINCNEIATKTNKKLRQINSK